jgi:hypothetical protein
MNPSLIRLPVHESFEVAQVINKALELDLELLNPAYFYSRAGELDASKLPKALIWSQVDEW